ncbi:hypothetical protein HK414_08985 [Ramlibacter terrae]|uniref:DUF4148 domain-containing protein n=1 Tax=Ramlibacter terrae TaxID=2732511 RepID=A0ABX6P1S4_9BURK|nr:hypothetical protein HK414_08985 [Ramlibacter terrae]
MNKSRILSALAASVLAISAQAGGIQARDVPRITNGGTGVIGGVEPGAYPYQANASTAMPHGRMATAATAPVRTMPQAQAQSTRNTAVMGSGAAQTGGDLAARHPARGTPD